MFLDKIFKVFEIGLVLKYLEINSGLVLLRLFGFIKGIN